MKKTILTLLVLAPALGCHGTTSIGGADAGCGVTFPASGFWGPNILYQGNDSFQSAGTAYELIAQHTDTESVTATLTELTPPSSTIFAPWSNTGTSGLANSQYATDWRSMGRLLNGDGSAILTQTFETPNVTGESEETIFFQGTGQARLEVFTCGSTTPVISKVIAWSPPQGDGGAAPDGSHGGVAPDGSVRADDGGVAPDGSLTVYGRD